MSYLERKGPWVRYPEERCPKCNQEIIEFDTPVSDIIITETFCPNEDCDYKVIEDIDIIEEVRE